MSLKYSLQMSSCRRPSCHKAICPLSISTHNKLPVYCNRYVSLAMKVKNICFVPSMNYLSHATCSQANSLLIMNRRTDDRYKANVHAVLFLLFPILSTTYIMLHAPADLEYPTCCLFDTYCIVRLSPIFKIVSKHFHAYFCTTHFVHGLK